MRIITLHQPYATLMFLKRNGHVLKSNETRSWHHEKVKGIIGIAAAKTMHKYAKDLMLTWPFCEDLKGVQLPLGVILGTVEIVSYQRSEDWMNEFSSPNLSPEQFEIEDREFRYGNYEPGRWIWRTKNATAFDEPIKAKGSQGWWSYETPKINASTGQLQLF
ncbi:hypothetical protein GO755_26495 [Spirosoma sp. HMF4905]|uniref:ASCH domain-containing protein n=1 Tax=Spirosoma arboris TaxID=2682092 RepID=A0A7K1SJ63_9BACT|nr:hypothetical protein [Spirosoma arboris]MVM33616.1 hypothetical protein [Spirosoma arboris]